MKKIAKKNQIVIATLAVMIAAAGYMNYSGKLFPGKTKTQETNSELANKELLDISDEDTSVSSGDIKSQDGDTGRFYREIRNRSVYSKGTCYRCDRGFDSYISDLSDYCMD